MSAPPLDRVLDAVAIGVYAVDMHGRATYLNPAGAAMLGWSVREFLGCSTHETVHHTRSDGRPYPPEDCSMLDAVRAGVRRSVEGEVFWRRDGSSFPVTYTTTPMFEDGRVVGAVVTFADVTRRVRAERQARTDYLTGLPNRRALTEALEDEISRLGRLGGSLSLALFDLDRFKDVNDEHGHGVGDDVLVETARRLESVAREYDTVARIGGEEFAWLLPQTDAQDAIAVAERARRLVRATPYPVVGTQTISAGVACGSGPSLHADRLMHEADMALYRAKDGGRDRVAGPGDSAGRDDD